MNKLIKNGIVILLLLVSSFLSAQSDSLINKKYTTLLWETCIEMTDAGCMVYEYGHLLFNERTVEVSGTHKVDCTTKERQAQFQKDPVIKTQEYKWKMEGEKIIIKGLDEFKVLRYKNGKLTGWWMGRKREFEIK